jgi:hypothetical protein
MAKQTLPARNLTPVVQPTAALFTWQAVKHRCHSEHHVLKAYKKRGRKKAKRRTDISREWMWMFSFTFQPLCFSGRTASTHCTEGWVHHIQSGCADSTEDLSLKSNPSNSACSQLLYQQSDLIFIHDNQFTGWWNFRFSWWQLWRWLSFGMLCHVVCRSLLTFQRRSVPPSSGRGGTSQKTVIFSSQVT